MSNAKVGKIVRIRFDNDEKDIPFVNDLLSVDVSFSYDDSTTIRDLYLFLLRHLNVEEISQDELQLRFNMHHLWSNSQLGEEIDENGFASIEIDEYEIIGNENTVYWMFRLIERRTKNARVFCVLSDRTKNMLLPIVKNNVLTNELEDDNLPENASIKTGIYSNCFRTYQINDFKNMGFVLVWLWIIHYQYG